MSELIGSAFFQDSTSNSGTVSNATFSDTASNSGAVTTAAFEGNASNSGTILQAATFSGSSTNSGAVSGSVVFSGSAVNVGIVEQAVFLDGAANTGTVSLSASFFGSSSNTGTIAGDAVFADTTSNSGTVQGSAQVAETASNTGTVDGSVTTYVQPDGAWANGYFYSGNKTAPPSYATVAYEVQGLVNVWYVYDYYGNGSLANGVYNDGTADFVFVNGIKTVAYEIPATFYLDSSTASRTVEVVGSGISMLDLGNGVKAASFDGGSYLRIQDSSAFNFGSGDFTVEFFFRRNQMTSGGEETIVSTAYPVDGSGIWLGLGFYGVGSLGLYAGGGGWAFGYGLLNLFAANSWIHAALTRVGNQFRMYHNGMLVWTQENGVTLNNANNQILIGGRGGQFFTGDLAGLRIVKGTALYTGSTYTVPTTLLTNVSNTELLLNFGAVNVPTVGSLSGAYSLGYAINNFIDLTYTNSTPQQAQDNSLYYTYASGIGTAAEGKYSNGAYVAGAVDTGGAYNTSTPFQAPDNNLYYTYTAGVPYPANGGYSVGYFTNAQIDATFTDLTGGYVAIDDSTAYSYLKGHIATYVSNSNYGEFYMANGSYAYPNGNALSSANLYYFDSVTEMTLVAVTTNLSGVSITGPGILPAFSLPNIGQMLYYIGGGESGNEVIFGTTVALNNTGNLYTNLLEYGSSIYTSSGLINKYISTNSNGVISLLNGAYSIGYYDANGDFDSTYNHGAPAVAEDGLYYTYASGAATAAEGRYSNGAYVAGAVDTSGTYDNVTPQMALDDSLYYTYASGVATAAEGRYSNGAYVAGAVDTSNIYDTAAPAIAQDDSLYYTYASGVETTAEGIYSNGAYVAGAIDTGGTYDSTTPAVAENSLYYTYASGVATAAEGRYSTGAYVAGAVDTGGTYDGTGTAQDDSQTYTYSSGAIV
jgi:Concanavalin A-like lectin/glucanases superfamily